MTPEELRKKMAKQREEVAALKEWFGELFPDHPELMVSDSQFGTWVRQYGFEYAVPALEDIAKKVNTIDQKITGKVTDKLTGKTVAPFTKLASWIMGQAKKKAEEA